MIATTRGKLRVKHVKYLPSHMKTSLIDLEKQNLPGVVGAKDVRVVTLNQVGEEADKRIFISHF